MGFNAAYLLVVAFSASYIAYAQEDNLESVDLNAGRVKRELVDLHNGEFCVDVSEWGDVVYTEEPREKCDSTFNKVCEMKRERVCGEVTEIECDIVPYTICRMDMNVTKYKSWQEVPKEYVKKTCTEGVMTVEHEKMMPNCQNITKLNCVTLWKTDENGKQVWAGNEDCEPVTWRECKLEAVKVGFKVPKMNCTDDGVVPWEDCEDVEKEKMTTSMTCTVEFATDCKPKISDKCNEIEFMECNEVPTETCETQTVQMPNQTYEHKKKCLLPDDGSIGVIGRALNEVGNKATKDNLETSETRKSHAQVKPDNGYDAPRDGRRLAQSLEQQALEQRRLQQLRQQQQLQVQQQRQARTFRGSAGPPRFQQRNGKAATAVHANSRRSKNAKWQGK